MENGDSKTETPKRDEGDLEVIEDDDDYEEDEENP